MDSTKYMNFKIIPRVLEQLNDPRLANLAGKLSEGKLLDLVNSRIGRAYYDTNSDNINYLQLVDNYIVRITTPRNEFKIISVGLVRKRNVINSIKNRRYIPIGNH